MLKTEACAATCGGMIPRWDLSIFSLWLYVIRLPFNSTYIIPCLVSWLSMNGKFGPMKFPDAPESSIVFVVVVRTKRAFFINCVISLVPILLLKSNSVLFFWDAAFWYNAAFA